jgi:hypothetical protein
VVQYADDMIIMFQPTELEVANLKFFLLCFENMSGLRINFHKSEVLVLGAMARIEIYSTANKSPSRSPT